MLSFLLAALALAGSPGPATLSLAATGAAFGARRGLHYMTGIIIGMIAVMGIVATGVVGVVLALPGATPVVAVAAAAYFIYLAGRIAMAPPLSERPDAVRPPTFTTGILLSLINPKGYAAMAALFSGFVLVRERPAFDAMLKTMVLLMLIVAINVAWLYAGAALTRLFRDPRSNRIVNLIFAILLIASVVMALVV